MISSEINLYNITGTVSTKMSIQQTQIIKNQQSVEVVAIWSQSERYQTGAHGITHRRVSSKKVPVREQNRLMNGWGCLKVLLYTQWCTSASGFWSMAVLYGCNQVGESHGGDAKPLPDFSSASSLSHSLWCAFLWTSWTWILYARCAEQGCVPPGNTGGRRRVGTRWYFQASPERST